MYLIVHIDLQITFQYTTSIRHCLTVVGATVVNILDISVVCLRGSYWVVAGRVTAIKTRAVAVITLRLVRAINANVVHITTCVTS